MHVARTNAAPHRCTHCRDPVPRGCVEPGAELQFCCAGCRTAHEVIHGCGLDRYYALRDTVDVPGATDADGTRPPPRRLAGGRDHAEFDDPAFARLYVRQRPDGMCVTELFLEGVHCAACLWLVERLPRVVPGLIESRLDFRRALVHITWDPSRTTLARAASALDRLGYAPHPARATGPRTARRRDERRQLVRLGVAGACAGNVMLLALAMYSGLLDRMEPAHLALFRWTSLALSVVAVAWPGAVFWRGAIAALRTRTMHLDVPIALGLVVGALWGAVNTIRGSGDVYFDSISVLVFALLLGRYVQQRQQRFSADAVELLFALTPSVANLVEAIDDPTPRAVPIEAVAKGDLVLVRAGESIPADGTVVSGASTVDRSLLTGESAPASVAVGAAVPAGAMNVSAPIVLRVAATGEETRVGRLMRLVEDAAQHRAPLVRAADRLAGWFAIIALLLAGVTAAAWWHAGPALAIERAVALLIVTCPCGLGLATPLAITVAIGRAARQGILIKGGEALERLATATSRSAKSDLSRGVVLLDKTGTITEGRLCVAAIAGDHDALALAAAAERHATHPAADAIRRAAGERTHAGERSPDDCVVLDEHHVAGAGVSAIVDGLRVVVGSPIFVSRVAAPPARLAGSLRRFAALGLTPVVIAVDGTVRAVVALGDTIRPDAAMAIDRIRQLGWSAAILSGDDPRVVDCVGDALGIAPEDRRGAQTPEDKLDVVRASVALRPTIMVGDGVNDAAALSAATVGVAVHGGAEASLAAADVHLGVPGLGSIADLLDGARRTIRVVRINLAVSLGYNVVAAGLCMIGWISPLLAAILMPASSLTVVALSMRGRTFVGRPRASGTGAAAIDAGINADPITSRRRYNSAPRLGGPLP